MEKEIIVMSDTHGSLENAILVIETFENIDTILHLGDDEQDVEKLKLKFPNKTFYNVAGNHDFQGLAPKEREVTICNKKIMLTHGHMQGVNFGLYTLSQWAKAKDASIVAFGHLHVTVNEIDDNLRIINPGSITLPRGSVNPTFGILRLSEDHNYNEFSLFEVTSKNKIKSI